MAHRVRVWGKCGEHDQLGVTKEEYRGWQGREFVDGAVLCEESGVGGRQGAGAEVAGLGDPEVVREREEDTGLVGLHDGRRREGV